MRKIAICAQLNKYTVHTNFPSNRPLSLQNAEKIVRTILISIMYVSSASKLVGKQKRRGQEQDELILINQPDQPGKIRLEIRVWKNKPKDGRRGKFNWIESSRV